MESQDKAENEVVETPEIPKITEWFLSKIDLQGRVTIGSGFRELYKLEPKDQVWVKIKKS